MKIEDGVIVRLKQEQYSTIMQYWGAFEILGYYPKHFYPQLANQLKNREVNDQFIIEHPLDDLVYDETLLIETHIKNLNFDRTPKVGMYLTTNFNGGELRGVIKDIRGEKLIIDCNHPFVGEKKIILSNYILEVRLPTQEEKSGLCMKDSPRMTLFI